MVESAKKISEGWSKECTVQCKNAVVKVDGSCLALVLFILNIFCPGFGTMISACGCCGRNFNCVTLAFGALQGYTSYFLFGWIWSIMHGYWIFKASK